LHELFPCKLYLCLLLLFRSSHLARSILYYADLLLRLMRNFKIGNFLVYAVFYEVLFLFESEPPVDKRFFKIPFLLVIFV
jgi:hypothetical protein